MPLPTILIVDDVPSGSPAKKAGIKAGDILHEHDERKLNGEPATLAQLIKDNSNKTPTSIRIEREGSFYTVLLKGGDPGVLVSEKNTQELHREQQQKIDHEKAREKQRAQKKLDDANETKHRIAQNELKKQAARKRKLTSQSNISRNTGLCPFSWIEVTKPAGCLSSLFGGRGRLVSEPQQCMRSNCQLWDSKMNECGLITKKE